MPKRRKLRVISDEIRRGARPQGAELTEADLGCLLSWLEGFGTVKPFDLGKRVWLKPFGLVMENAEQRDRRKTMTTKPKKPQAQAQPRFTVEAGRSICRDGQPVFTVTRADGVAPTEADELCHILVALLNGLGDEEIETTYLGGEALRLR